MVFEWEGFTGFLKLRLLDMFVSNISLLLDLLVDLMADLNSPTNKQWLNIECESKKSQF